MAEINLWQGNVKIIPEEQVKTMDGGEGQQKFDTCRHRSVDKVEHINRGCCSSTKMIGWECKKRNIFNITPKTCASCKVYQQKGT